jgi:hypothetical protein
MPSRPQRSLFAAACFGIGSAVTGGCTFLVDFVSKELPVDALDDGTFQPDVDTSFEASLDDTFVPPDSSPPPPDAASDGRSDVRVDAPQCPNPCKNRGNGWYCGSDGLFCLAPADDLYHCVSDAPYDVTSCTQGAGCVQLPPQHPDTCDPCPGKADGFYCGRDLSNIVPHVPGDDKNDIYLFNCQGGRISLASKACITDCTGTPPNAKCNPN